MQSTVAVSDGRGARIHWCARVPSLCSHARFRRRAGGRPARGGDYWKLRQRLLGASGPRRMRAGCFEAEIGARSSAKVVGGLQVQAPVPSPRSGDRSTAAATGRPLAATGRPLAATGLPVPATGRPVPAAGSDRSPVPAATRRPPGRRSGSTRPPPRPHRRPNRRPGRRPGRPRLFIAHWGTERAQQQKVDVPRVSSDRSVRMSGAQSSSRHRYGRAWYRNAQRS